MILVIDIDTLHLPHNRFSQLVFLSYGVIIQKILTDNQSLLYNIIK